MSLDEIRRRQKEEHTTRDKALDSTKKEMRERNTGAEPERALPLAGGRGGGGGRRRRHPRLPDDEGPAGDPGPREQGALRPGRGGELPAGEEREPAVELPGGLRVPGRAVGLRDQAHSPDLRVLHV